MPGRIDQPNSINLTGGASIGPPAAVNAGRVDGVTVDLAGIAGGDTLTYDAGTNTLVPGAPTGGTGLDLTGRAHGDVLWVDATGTPAAAWLAIPSDWATGDPYVLTVGAGRPAWRRAVGVVLDIPGTLTVDADTLTADSIDLTADQTEI